MRPRTAMLAMAAALVLSAPAAAQEPPASLYRAAPAQDPGTAASPDGRSPVLLALALTAVAGAGLLAVLAVRRPATPVAAEPEPTCAWRPRVVADPPLPAFGPGSHTGVPSAPPPPD